MKKQYRQGDVLIERIDKLPADFKAGPLEGGRVILAHGEATGHAHAFASAHAEKFVAPERDEYFRVTGEEIRGKFAIVRKWRGQVMIAHPQHGHIEFAAEDVAIKGKFVHLRGRFGLLKHDEHSTQAIPAGFYRGGQEDGTVRQREYSPEAIRSVQD